MNLPRRRFLQLAAGAVALPAVSRVARAQTYPGRPVRIIVAAAAGGATDIAARLIAQSLTERLGQSFFVENRPGGNNNIGTEAVVRAPADGYTLLMANSVNAVNASLYEHLSYNFVRDLTPVARISDTPSVMVVHPQFPARSVLEFVAYAKANPGRLNFGTSGAGTQARVVSEMFKMATGLNLALVHYRGEAPALADLLGQQIDVIFATLPGSIEYGVLAYLKVAAVEERKTFLMIMARILPLKISGEVKQVKDNLSLEEAVIELKAYGLDEALAYYLKRYPIQLGEEDVEFAKLIDVSLADRPLDVTLEDVIKNDTAGES